MSACEAIADEPGRILVPWADVRLRCRWPSTCGTSILRGAVCAEIDRLAGGEPGPDPQTWRAHVDWHGHVEGGRNRYTPAPIAYRIDDDGPRIYIAGPRTAERLAELGRLSAVRLPAGEVVPIDGLDVAAGEAHVGPTRHRWRRYELVTPLYPPSVAELRRPRQPGPERVAWASRLLTNGIVQLLHDWGLDGAPPIHVHVVNYRDERVDWRDRTWAVGFRARIVADVDLPPGVGLGQHRAEGFGELRPWPGGSP